MPNRDTFHKRGGRYSHAVYSESDMVEVHVIWPALGNKNSLTLAGICGTVKTDATSNGYVMEKQSYRAKISGGRRVVLPNEACEKLKLGIGDTVVLDVVGDSVRIRPMTSVVKDVRALAAKFIRPGESLVDELLRERREEAARD
jgi:bifunctional DNA-binding transcriptional regulator/antitoxin component of YhaV-PrlF toxin-antitoxin module